MVAAGSRRWTRASGLIAAAVMLAALPAAVYADTGNGGISIAPRDADDVIVDISGARLDSRLMATISFRVTCEEITYFDWELGQEVTTTAGRLFADAFLAQAQGRSIATAAGAMHGVDVTCDGATVNQLAIQVIAQSLPLKRGDALAGVATFVGAGEGEDHGASGPTSLRLR